MRHKIRPPGNTALIYDHTHTGMEGPFFNNQEVIQYNVC
jgi:hypothetical protein